MARSTYIYIITNPHSEHGVVAAFTVKHECQSWLEDCTHSDKDRFLVCRYTDSPWDTDSIERGVPVTFKPNTHA